MSVSSDEPLTVPAVLAARKHKVARKSAKGRKLMRWGPDEDQQLLLATEAVVIEGSVELDWNLVGLKMAHQVTGEAIKQHLYKVREARESAGMITPAKAEGKSAFGTRRGVARYPPAQLDTNNLSAKKRSRPDPKTSRSKAKVDDEESEYEEVQPVSKKIKHSTLLFGPAIPREAKEESSASPSPAPMGSVEPPAKPKKESKEEGGTVNAPAPTAQPSRKRARKPRKSTNVVGDKAPVAKKGRAGLPSNCVEADWVEHVNQRTAGDLGRKLEATETETIPASFRKNSESNPGKTVGPFETPLFSQRTLRNKEKRPDYRDDNVTGDFQSQVSADSYKPEMSEGIALDEEPHMFTDSKPHSFANAQQTSTNSVELHEFQSEQTNTQPVHKYLNPYDLPFGVSGSMQDQKNIQVQHTQSLQRPTIQPSHGFVEGEALSYQPSVHTQNTPHDPLSFDSFNFGPDYGFDRDLYNGDQQPAPIPDYLQPQQLVPRYPLMQNFQLYDNVDDEPAGLMNEDVMTEDGVNPGVYGNLDFNEFVDFEGDYELMQ